MITPYKARNLDETRRVRVYRNLNSPHGRYSVQQEEGANRWVVVGHCDEIDLSHCEMIISAAGQRRVRERKRKNVHAFIQGFIACSSWIGGTARLFYDPYTCDTFVDGTTYEPVTRAPYVHLSTSICYGLPKISKNPEDCVGFAA